MQSALQVVPASLAVVSPVPCFSTSTDLALVSRLSKVCKKRFFKRGETLRKLGTFYNDAYILLDGSFDVELLGCQTKISRKNGPIGEIGFLHGTAASATVTAGEDASALLLDDAVLDNLRRDEPDLANGILSMLSSYAQCRVSESFFLSGGVGSGQKSEGGGLDIFLCRSEQQLLCAQQLRYDVYCNELGRSSPFADSERGTISDNLDGSGRTFIGTIDGQAVGTLRANFCRDSSLGEYVRLYNLRECGRPFDEVAILTKFILSRSVRGSKVAMQLVSTLTRHLISHGIRVCYIDCIPSLLPYYRAMGFVVAGEAFVHPENGLSIPLMIDLDRHGKVLSGQMGEGRMMWIYVLAKVYRGMGWLGGLFRS